MTIVTKNLTEGEKQSEVISMQTVEIDYDYCRWHFNPLFR